MASTISYKKFGLIELTTTWFNTDPSFGRTKFRGIHILRQSVPILDIGSGVCIRQDTQTTSIIDLTESEEQLWKGLDPKSCRYEIRKIKKLTETGENIRITNKGDAKTFLNIANRYIKKKGYTKALKEWQLSMYLERGNGELLTIHYDGRMIGGNFYIKDHPGRVRLLYSFNDRWSNKSVAKLSGALMRYLHWHAIQMFKAQGFRWYDTGGVNLDKNSSTYGIAQFKLSLGGFLREENNYVFASSRWIGKLHQLYRLISHSKAFWKPYTLYQIVRNKARQFLVDLQRYQKRYGTFHLFTKIIHRLISPIIDCSSNLLFEWHGTGLSQIEEKCSLEIDIGSEADINNIVNFYGFSKNSSGELKTRERLARGDKPYLAFSGESLVHISWLSRWPKVWVSAIWGYLSLKKGQAYIFKCSTNDHFRGKNIYPIVLQRILKDMAADNVKQVFITCHPSNIASIKGIEKAGFSLQRKLYAFRVFGKKIGSKMVEVN